MNWGEIITLVIGGGLVTQVGNFLVQRRKVDTTAKQKDAERSDALTMQMWVEITKEQRDWREVMRREIDRLQSQCTKLTEENATLLRRIAELEGHNDDLKRDNDELEARVKELERDLRKRDEEKAVA